MGKFEVVFLRTELKKRMMERGAKPIDIAKAADISVSFVYKIMASTRNPTMKQAKKIADFLDSSVDYLFFSSYLDETGKNEQAATNF